MNMGDYDNRTALHLACCEGHISCVKFLIDVCKVDINIKDRWGYTPLDEAMKTNNTMAINLLKKHRETHKIPVFDDISEFNEESGYGSPINKRNSYNSSESEAENQNSDLIQLRQNGYEHSDESDADVKSSSMTTHFTKMSLEKGDGKKNFKYIN